jgi:DNA-directed RNA polymerase specialized sigma24 family protein
MSESDSTSAPKPDWYASDLRLDRETLDRLFSVTYEELRRLASRVKRSDWNASISPTTLVNEAWMKLTASPSFRSTSPLHFKRIAARAMRQVLVEAARRRHAARRGGEDVTFVTFDESIGHGRFRQAGEREPDQAAGRRRSEARGAEALGRAQFGRPRA